MAKAKESEVDAWTSNGIGVKLTSKPTTAQKAAVDKINREMAAQQTPDYLAQFKTDDDFFKHMENLEKEALAELEAEGVPVKDE
jgi:hypothetical protein